MKILSIQARFYPAIGGIEWHTYLLYKYLAQENQEITIYTTSSLSREDLLSITLSPPFIHIPNIKPKLKEEEYIEKCLVKRFESKLRFWGFNWTPELFKDIKYNISKYDIIHAHGYHLISTIVGCYYAKKYKKPFVLTAHDIVLAQDFPIDAKVFKCVFDITLGRYLLQNATRLIALTEAQQTQYVEKGANAKKIRIIPNGIELSPYLENNSSACISRSVIKIFDDQSYNDVVESARRSIETKYNYRTVVKEFGDIIGNL